jgi:transposase
MDTHDATPTEEAIEDAPADLRAYRTVQRAPRFKLYPTEEQRTALLAWEKSLRWLWNVCLEQTRMARARSRYDRQFLTAATEKHSAALKGAKAAKAAGVPFEAPPETETVETPLGCWKWPDSLSQQRQLTELQRECAGVPAVDSLSKVPRYAKGAVVTALETAWKRYFALRTPGEPGEGEPQFKRSGQSVPIEFAGVFTHFDGAGWKGSVYVPTLGDVKANLHTSPFACRRRECEGDKCEVCAARTARKLTRIVITRDVDEWFVAIAVSWSEPEPAPITVPIVGVNRGIGILAATSTGELFEGPRFVQRAQEQLERRQAVANRRADARHARCEAVRRAVDAKNLDAIAAALKGEAPKSEFTRWVNAMLRWDAEGRHGFAPRCGQGENEKKAREQVAKRHRKTRRQRESHLHMVSRRIADAAGTVVMEALDIQKLTKSAAGTVEAPGKLVQKKANHNRAALDGGWGALATMTEYKVVFRGGTFAKRNPAFAAQTCPVCGHVAAENRPDCRTFLCAKCGHTEQGDVLTGKNLVAGYVADGTGTAAKKPPKRTKRVFKPKKVA